MFKLAHISDPHLGPMPKVEVYQLLSKRFLGWANWNRNRKRIHDMEVLASITAHINHMGVDHVAVTGDLVNIALPAEFSAAEAWLRTLGAPAHVSLVPGNHDSYVDVPKKRGVELWREYMRGEEGSETLEFPFIRRCGPIALIGMSSSVPSMPFRATGRIRKEQYRKAAAFLDEARAEGLARVILIHHPPMPGLSPHHKRLKRSRRFAALLRAHGAELVLHGHLHKTMVNYAAGKDGQVPIVGVPSASCSGYDGKEPASWHLYEIERREGGFQIAMVRYGLAITAGSQAVRQLSRRMLTTAG